MSEIWTSPDFGHFGPVRFCTVMVPSSIRNLNWLALTVLEIKIIKNHASQMAEGPS